MARFATSLGMAGFVCVCSFEHENPRELDLRYVLVIHTLKNRSMDVKPLYKGLMRECVCVRATMCMQASNVSVVIVSTRQSASA